MKKIVGLIAITIFLTIYYNKPQNIDESTKVEESINLKPNSGSTKANKKNLSTTMSNDLTLLNSILQEALNSDITPKEAGLNALNISNESFSVFNNKFTVLDSTHSYDKIRWLDNYLCIYEKDNSLKLVTHLGKSIILKDFTFKEHDGLNGPENILYNEECELIFEEFRLYTGYYFCQFKEPRSKVMKQLTADGGKYIGKGLVEKSQSRQVWSESLSIEENIYLYGMDAWTTDVWYEQDYKLVNKLFDISGWSYGETKKNISAKEEISGIEIYLKVANNEFIIDQKINIDAYSTENLNNLNTQELRIARNTVFAYYGRPFASEDLKNYFSEQAWYSINYQYDDNLISPDHKELINRVKKMESKKPVLSTDEEGGGSEDAKIKKAYNQFVKNNNHIKKNIKQYIRKCIKDGSLNMKDVVDFFSENPSRNVKKKDIKKLLQ